MLNKTVSVLSFLILFFPAFSRADAPAVKPVDTCEQAAQDKAAEILGYNPSFLSDLSAKLVSSGWNELTYSITSGPNNFEVIIPAMIGHALDGSEIFICD